MLGRALQVLSQIFWAAGAEKLLPGVRGIPDVLHSKEEAEILRTQEPEGGWASLNNTCLALLFLERVTYSRMARAKQMPATLSTDEWRFSLACCTGIVAGLGH